MPGYKREGRSIRELRDRLGGPDKVEMIGWRPLDGGKGQIIVSRGTPPQRKPPVDFRPTMDDGYHERRKPIAPPIAPKLDAAAAEEREREVRREALRALNRARKQAAKERREAEALELAAIAERDLPPVPDDWRLDLIAIFRARWPADKNLALDLWAEGVSGVEISKRLGHTNNATVAAHWIPHARKCGDPRAVVRQPQNFGVSRNRRCKGKPRKKKR